MALRIAIYGRKSTDKQATSSIPAQIEYNKKYARRNLGISNDDLTMAEIFADDSISGTKDESERPGFAALLAGWDANRFDLILVESQSRLCRDELQSVTLRLKIQKTKQRIVCCGNSLDTHLPGWEDTWRRCGQQDEDYVVKVSKEVTRGILDMFELGFHIGDYPYGYHTVKALDETGATHFKLQPSSEPLKLVRRMFDERLSGKSMWAIARGLNRDAIPSPKGKLWSAVGISKMLRNPLYRGFVYYGGIEYPRPDCRIVTVEEWQKVQPADKGGSLTRSGRGGLKTWASGAFGVCEEHKKALSVKTVNGKKYIHCSRCLTGARLGGKDKPAYAPLWALEKLLVAVLKDAFTTDALTAFRARVSDLKDKIPTDEIDANEKALQRISGNIARINDLIIENEDETQFITLNNKLAKFNQERRALKARKQFLTESLPALDPAVYDMQLNIDPAALLPLAFAKGDQAALAMVLPGLFKNVVMARDSGNHTYDFRMSYSLSRAIASLTNTVALLDDFQEADYRVITWRDQRATCYRKDGDSWLEMFGQVKQCYQCKKVLPLEQFYKVDNEGTMRVGDCRTCRCERSKINQRNFYIRQKQQKIAA
jgi:DNA invertase Pin-like site-specific DNA recombinase